MNATYFDSIKRQLLLISDYIFMAQFFSSLTYDNFYGNYFLCSYCNTMEKKSLTLCVSNVSRVCKFFAMSYCSSRYKQIIQITSLFLSSFLPGKTVWYKSWSLSMNLRNYYFVLQLLRLLKVSHMLSSVSFLWEESSIWYKYNTNFLQRLLITLL